MTEVLFIQVPSEKTKKGYLYTYFTMKFINRNFNTYPLGI